MITKDISKSQLETLVLLRALKEHFKDSEYFDDLNDAVAGRMEGGSIDRENFIRHICVLTQKGYVQSDADEDNITFNELPLIEDITLKGEELLDAYVIGLTEKEENDQNTVKATKAGNEYSLVKEININFSILGGMEFSLSVFKNAPDFADFFRQLRYKIIGK